MLYIHQIFVAIRFFFLYETLICFKKKLLWHTIEGYKTLIIWLGTLLLYDFFNVNRCSQFNTEKMGSPISMSKMEEFLFTELGLRFYN